MTINFYSAARHYTNSKIPKNAIFCKQGILVLAASLTICVSLFYKLNIKHGFHLRVYIELSNDEDEPM